MAGFLKSFTVTADKPVIAAMGRAKPAAKTVATATAAKATPSKLEVALDVAQTPLQKQYSKNQGGGGITAPPPTTPTEETISSPQYSVEEALEMAVPQVDLTPVVETQEKLQAALAASKTEKKSLADKWNALSDTNKALIAVGGAAAIMGVAWYFSAKK